VILLLVVALAATYTMKILVRTKERLNADGRPCESYTEVSAEVFGKIGAGITIFGVASSQLGTCVLYVIYISQNLKLMVGHHIDTRLWMLMLLPVFAVLVQVRNFKLLSRVSALGIVAVLSACGVIAGYGIAHPTPPSSFPIVTSNVLLGFGIAVFTLEGINLALPLANSMARRESFEQVLNIGVLLTTLLYCSFAATGFIVFGDNVNSVITCDLPKGSPVVLAVQIAIVIELSCSYPLQMSPVLQLVEEPFIDRNAYFLDKALAGEIVRTAIRVLFVAATVGVAVVLPLFGLVTNLIGSFSFTLVGFILPCTMYMWVFGRALPKYETAACLVVTIAGTAVGMMSTVQTLIQIVRAIIHGKNTGSC